MVFSLEKDIPYYNKKKVTLKVKVAKSIIHDENLKIPRETLKWLLCQKGHKTSINRKIERWRKTHKQTGRRKQTRKNEICLYKAHWKKWCESLKVVEPVHYLDAFSFAQNAFLKAFSCKYFTCFKVLCLFSRNYNHVTIMYIPVMLNILLL